MLPFQEIIELDVYLNGTGSFPAKKLLDLQQQYPLALIDLKFFLKHLNAQEVILFNAWLSYKLNIYGDLN
ncbi:MAG: hypothetical protein AAF598_04700 [Bacteroidota bacterium]